MHGSVFRSIPSLSHSSATPTPCDNQNIQGGGWTGIIESGGIASEAGEVGRDLIGKGLGFFKKGSLDGREGTSIDCHRLH